MIKLIYPLKIYLSNNNLSILGSRKIRRFVHKYGFDSDEEIIQNCLDNVMMIGINLPDKKNVLTETAVEKLCKNINYFETTDEISVAVLHGIGGNFCTGLEPTEAALEKSRELMKALNNTSKPIIGSFSGYTSNFGFHLAIMCDIRVMEDNAMAGFGEKLQRSEYPDFLLRRLVLNVGMSNALELISITGLWTAAECFQRHFINRSVNCGCSLGQSLQWAQNMAKFPAKIISEEKSKVLNVSKNLNIEVQ